MTDVIIIGGGPAGLSAAIYAKRAGLSVQIIDKGAAECQLAKAAEVENYLGFKSINGAELHSAFVEHVKHANIPIVKKSAVSLTKSENGFTVRTKKDEFQAKHVILAMGRSHKHLNIEGEDRFIGAGMSYCATCDGFFFKDREVCVIGGGDSALSQALYLSGICSKVNLVHRRKEFRAASYLVERAKATPNIDFVLDAVPTKIMGEQFCEALEVEFRDGTRRTIPSSGVFGAIGEKANLSFSIEGLKTTEQGQIITDNLCRTSIENLYAVGDIREREVYQVVTAVADGPLVLEAILKA